MKNILRLLLLVSLTGCLFLAGCSVRIYGVPKEEWHRMTPAEQQQAREAYEKRRRLSEKRRLYEARQRAHEAEQRAHEAELKAREAELRAAQQQAREAAAHRPAPLAYDRAPALIHFTLEGGTVYIAGRHRPFQPVTVTLRQGESKRVVLVTTDERRPYHVQFVCSYEEGVLWLSNGKSRVQAQRIAYDGRWHKGQRYQNLELGSGVGLRGGILLVGSGVMPPIQHSHPNPDSHNEKPQGQEKKDNNCRDDYRRPIRPGSEDNCNPPDKMVQEGKRVPALPATSYGNGRKTSDSNSDDSKIKPPHHSNNAGGAMAAAQAQGKMNNGGNNQDVKKGGPRRQESASSLEKKPQRQGPPSAQEKGKAKEKQQANKSDSGACHGNAAAGKKSERTDCEDESVMSKANTKGKQD